MWQQSPTVSTEWWLDWSGLPDRLLWARIRHHGDGRVTIFDCDGNTHDFPSYQAARGWLVEEEYSQLESLVEAGDVPAGTEPPHAESDAKLVKLIVAATRTAT